MEKTEFQKNIINTKNLNLEIDCLKTKLDNKNKIIDDEILSLKNDLKITLENNDIINLELRKLKLYNFLFKIAGSASVILNIYFISKKL